jgi:adenylate kinase family enzyme
VPRVSAVNVIHDAIAKGAPLARKFRTYAEFGRFVPDTLIDCLVWGRLSCKVRFAPSSLDVAGRMR